MERKQEHFEERKDGFGDSMNNLQPRLATTPHVIVLLWTAQESTSEWWTGPWDLKRE